MSEQDSLAPVQGAARQRALRQSVAGLLLLALGIISLFVLAGIERRWLAEVPWHDAIRTVDYTIEDKDAIPVWSWALTPEQSVGDSVYAQWLLSDLQKMIALKESSPEKLKEESPVVALTSTDMLEESLLPRARLVMFDRDSGFFQDVLAEGRLPEAGKREVLAGPLTSSRPLEIDGEIYDVVGRLHPHVAGVLKTFVMPASAPLRAALDQGQESALGSVHLNPGSDLHALIPELAGEGDEDLPDVYGSRALTRSDIAWGVWFSLLLVAIGATFNFMSLYRFLTTMRLGILNSVFQEIEIRRGLLWGLHILLFGGFFGAMAAGLGDVEMIYIFTEYVSHEFTEGGLKYVGEAYASGNIPRAAHATFRNNFIYQTVLFGAIPSQVLLGIGVLKTMMSFTVVGFAMAPAWTGVASGMTYHSITLALELPPYVLAAFGMMVWALAAIDFIWSPVRVWYLGDKVQGVPVIQDAYRRLPQAFLVLVATVLMAGVFLYVAAWYEAATLIRFQ